MRSIEGDAEEQDTEEDATDRPQTCTAGGGITQGAGGKTTPADAQGHPGMSRHWHRPGHPSVPEKSGERERSDENRRMCRGTIIEHREPGVHRSPRTTRHTKRMPSDFHEGARVGREIMQGEGEASPPTQPGQKNEHKRTKIYWHSLVATLAKSQKERQEGEVIGSRSNRTAMPEHGQNKEPGRTLRRQAKPSSRGKSHQNQSKPVDTGPPERKSEKRQARGKRVEPARGDAE